MEISFVFYEWCDSAGSRDDLSSFGLELLEALTSRHHLGLPAGDEKLQITFEERYG